MVLMAFPLISFYAWLNFKTGYFLIPDLRPVPEHAHLMPKLVDYLKSNKLDDYQDFLGRNNGKFYRTVYCQDFTKKPDVLQKLNDHGFNF